MAQKPKAGSPKKKTLAADKQKAQSARFIEAAREAGVDESGKEFDRALRAVAQPKRRRDH